MLTAQVTYPDFKYDCEALAVDPATRYIESRAVGHVDKIFSASHAVKIS